jgi:hypothetical protein
MKSSVIPEAEKPQYSDLKVMRSAAGYYIGTSFRDEAGDETPGSRDSGYLPTEADAQSFLQLVNSLAETDEEFAEVFLEFVGISPP